MKYEKDVLYLDYDGVLHPEDVYWKKKKGIFLRDNPGHTLFENCQLLETLLAPYPSVKIVLCTSWVRALKSYTRARKRLTPGLQARCVGATFHSDMRYHMGLGYSYGDFFSQLSRYVQIKEDLDRRRPERYLALDDDTDGWPAAQTNWLVAPYTPNGIAEPDVLKELKSKLERTFGG